MLKRRLIEQVGHDHYRDACMSARRDAEREDFGRSSLGDDDSSLTPHEVSDALWECEASPSEKIGTLFEIFDEMPSGALLMYVSHHYLEWPVQVRQQFWEGVRQRLAGADRALARPLAYYLWCDWFEHGDFTAEAWDALTGAGTPPLALQQVLIASGPVPWTMKTAVYQRLAPNIEWHYYIFRSVLHSAFDVLGKIDKEDAARWLEQLVLEPDTDYLAELREELLK